ncbi:MAG: ornithine carbamoyltransferase [Acidobacteria bacterium]|nr:ornithine carbamoyltransferase [Acidobacteriota bacterium]
MTISDLVSIHDLSREEVLEILDLAARIKRDPVAFQDALSRRTLAMIFEKPSLRTRVSFEAGMTQLGGHAICLGPSDISMGRRESVADIARTLSGMADGIMARTFSHQAIVDLAQHAAIPVINGLSDRSHPCQALADFLTIREALGRCEGIRLAYVGDGNNVTHSLMYAAARLGASVSVATPPGYAPDPDVVRQAREVAARFGATLAVGHNVDEAVAGADVIYTDTWASMGQEAEHDERVVVFRPYQVDASVMARAGKGALFMHCLPAHRGEEVTDDVFESKASVVFQQAANRLHAQKAVLALLLGGAGR